MKKIISSGIVISLAMLVMSGCNKFANEQVERAQETTEIQTIEFWHHYGEPVSDKLEELTNRFNDGIGKEQGISVKLVGKSNIKQLMNEVNEAAQGIVYANKMPNLFFVYPDGLLDLHNIEVVADMNQSVSEQTKESIVPEFMKSGTIDGKWLHMPFANSTELLYINETAWDEFAMETGHTFEDLETWEGVLEVGRDYYEYTDELTPEIPFDGHAFFGFDSLDNFITVTSMQLGVDIFDKDEKTAYLNEAVLREIFELYNIGTSMGYFYEGGKFRSDDVRSGKIISYVGSSVSFQYFPDWIETANGKQDIKWCALPYPTFEQGDAKVYSQGAGLAMGKSTKEKEDATAVFISYLMENNIEFSLATGYIPVIDRFLEMNDTNTLQDNYQLDEKKLQVYDLVLNQIKQGELYLPAAFKGSYQIRNILGEQFHETGKDSLSVAQSKKEQVTTLADVEESLNLEEQYKIMFNKIESILENSGISYFRE